MNLLLKVAAAVHIWIYRGSGGRRGVRLGGQEFALLTTTGRKSGALRTVIVLSFEDGGDRVVVASASGSPSDPAWCLNLRANPRVTVQYGPDVYSAQAVVTDPAEREVLWKKILSKFPKYADHERKAKRAIPVVRLVRATR